MTEEQKETYYVILNMNIQYEICRMCPKSGLFKGTYKECEAWIKGATEATKELQEEVKGQKEYIKYLKRQRQGGIQKQYNKVEKIKELEKQLTKAKELQEELTEKDNQIEELEKQKSTILEDCHNAERCCRKKDKQLKDLQEFYEKEYFEIADRTADEKIQELEKHQIESTVDDGNPYDENSWGNMHEEYFVPKEQVRDILKETYALIEHQKAQIEKMKSDSKTAYIKGIRTMANALKKYDRINGAWTDYFEHTVDKVLKNLLKE